MKPAASHKHRVSASTSTGSVAPESGSRKELTPVQIRGIYGVSNHSPYLLGSILKQQGHKVSLLHSRYSGKPPKSPILLASSVRILHSYWETLMPNHLVFVFDNPASLAELGSPIPLDYDLSKTFCCRMSTFSHTELQEKLAQCIASPEQKDLSYQEIDLLPQMLSEVIPSILTPLQNFLYSIQDVEIRLEKSRAFYSWFASNQELDTLESSLALSSKPKKSLIRLLEFVGSSDGARIREAVHQRLYSKVAINKLQKQYGLDKFDLVFMVKKIGTLA